MWLWIKSIGIVLGRGLKTLLQFFIGGVSFMVALFAISSIPILEQIVTALGALILVSMIVLLIIGVGLGLKEAIEDEHWKQERKEMERR